MTAEPRGVDPAWAGVRRVLAVRLDQLGDVLMTTPALAAIRAGAPRARLTLLTSRPAAALVPLLPDIDEAIVFDAPWMKPPLADGEGAGVAERRLVNTLAAQRFDAAVIFGVCTQSALPAALLCRMAGIPLRLAHCRENPYGLLSDWVPERDVVADGMRHEVARQLALVGAVGWQVSDTRLRLALRASDHAEAQAALRAAGVDPARPYLVVHPGASAASRRWPAERFGAAAAQVAARTGAQLVVTGGPGEAALVAQVQAAIGGGPAAALVGTLGLGALAATIAGARLLVANNSGPAHIAAATGTPLVVPYAQTNPQHTPWQARARVLQRDVPCRHCLKSQCPQGHHDCLQGIEAEAVAAAGLALLAEHAAPRAVAA